MRPTRGLVLGAMLTGLALVASPAFAQTNYGTDLPSDGNGPGASGVVSNLVITRIGTETNASPTESRITELAGGNSFSRPSARLGTSVGNNSLASTGSHVAGQGGQRRWGLWLNGAYSDIDYDKSNLKFDGDSYSVGFGLDYMVMDNVVIGISAAYEDTDLDLQSAQGKFDRDGWTVGPYLAIRLGQYFTLSGALGFSWLDAKSSSGVGGREKYDTDRWYATTNLAFNYPAGNWRLGANVGYLYIDEEDDAHTTSNGFSVGKQNRNVMQGRVGAQVGYDFGGIVPYVMGRLEHEFEAPDTVNLFAGGVPVQQEKPDRTGFVVGLGVNFYYGALSGGLLATSQEARDKLDVYTFTANIRMAF
jgi:outer membrane autotransporter protein